MLVKGQSNAELILPRKPPPSWSEVCKESPTFGDGEVELEIPNTGDNDCLRLKEDKQAGLRQLSEGNAQEALALMATVGMARATSTAAQARNTRARVPNVHQDIPDGSQEGARPQATGRQLSSATLQSLCRRPCLTPQSLLGAHPQRHKFLEAQYRKWKVQMPALSYGASGESSCTLRSVSGVDGERVKAPRTFWCNVRIMGCAIIPETARRR
ncbi:hypothetical protein DFH07DRAFT_773408 [Mycena maculata]|uniref:Uncharacterized protein n=1 Tax=Mycena maculata TaxID=230809 RepID=A0AAD7J287_9AGAR|nr:hypothetical protein DFH07DRAFT_773408 [Mycena maculata]